MQNLRDDIVKGYAVLKLYNLLDCLLYGLLCCLLSGQLLTYLEIVPYVELLPYITILPHAVAFLCTRYCCTESDFGREESFIQDMMDEYQTITAKKTRDLVEIIAASYKETVKVESMTYSPKCKRRNICTDDDSVKALMWNGKPSSYRRKAVYGNKNNI